jgi:CRISPR-associated protein Cmr3
MHSDTRSVEEGKLFSMQALAMKQNVGFLAAVSGANPPKGGLLRFGGDGRAASLSTVNLDMPTPDYDAISKAGRCRLILTSPGVFPAGWKLPGTGDDNRISLGGVKARLVSAAVPRSEVISGWDLAQWRPKPAQRVAPAGSVYWLDELDATREALCKLAIGGLWSDPCEDPARRAEGFNRFTFAAWNQA